MKTINVVAGVILFDQKFLCVQRGVGKFDYISKKFEFPGGKIEVDESQDAALAREIKEELEKEISVDQKLMVVDHTYPDFRIIMHTYLCSTKDDHLKLTEHIAFKWLPVSELNSLDWAAADIPIVQKLIELNANNQLPQG
ncbi:MAG: (deoxy)nucleoside triphosphate pyrophosphohydrolase [Sphingobacteriales bacterium]|nr:MAG: (deoxy)nucleoside triphosphate pyrophosphohydrolase [Sphingobacteriales bacterium]